MAASVRVSSKVRRREPERYVCHEPEIMHVAEISLSQFDRAMATHCEEALLRIASLFNVADPRPAVQAKIAEYLKKK